MRGLKDPDGNIEFFEDYSDFWEKYSQYGSRKADHFFIFPGLEYLSRRLNFYLDITIFSVLERLGHIAIFPTIILFILELLKSEGI